MQKSPFLLSFTKAPMLRAASITPSEESKDDKTKYLYIYIWTEETDQIVGQAKNIDHLEPPVISKFFNDGI